MTNEENMQSRIAMQLYRKVKQENEKLREQLAEKNRLDLRMDAEDAEVFAMVAANKGQKPEPEVIHPYQALFDFDTAEVEPVDVQEFIPLPEPERSKFRIPVKLGLLILFESLVWLAHHFGWIDLIMTITIGLIVFFLTNMHVLR